MGRSEYEDLTESFTVGGTLLKKAVAFRAFMGRLNVYAGLYFTEVTWEYATPNNLVIFSGEDKHR